MIFQFGLKPVLIQRILIGLEAILEKHTYISISSSVDARANKCNKFMAPLVDYKTAH